MRLTAASPITEEKPEDREERWSGNDGNTTDPGEGGGGGGSGGGVSTGAAAGIGVGVGVPLLAGLITALFFLFRERKRTAVLRAQLEPAGGQQPQAAELSGHTTVRYG